MSTYSLPELSLEVKENTNDSNTTKLPNGKKLQIKTIKSSDDLVVKDDIKKTHNPRTQIYKHLHR